ncbi:MAG: TolC family protein [Kiritimatiellae bacterium]|nr:TolC family protein [Kiritimatiellia bacterium]
MKANHIAIMCRSGAIAAVGACFLAGIAGCETISRARNAQAEVQELANEAAEKPKIKFVNPGLKDFLDYALANRPDMEAADLAVEDAELALKEVLAERWIQVGAGASYGQATANGSHWSWREHRGKFNGNVNAELLIYDFGRVDAREAAARESLVAAQETYAEKAWSVFDEVATAYFTLLQNDALLDVARTNEVECALHLDQAQELFDAQEAKKLDVLRAELDLSDAKLRTINASNDVITATAELFKVLGIEADMAAREDVLPVRGDALAEAHTVFAPSEYRTVAALEKARESNPTLKVLRAKVRMAHEGVNYSIADLYPNLTVGAGFNFTDPAWNFNWAADVAQTVFQGGRKVAEVDRAVVALKTAWTQYEAAGQQLSRDIDVAIAVRDNARQSLETAKVQVRQAQDNLELVTHQFRLGDASRVDFTDAVGDLADALGVRVKAFYAGQMAEARLISLIGCADKSHETEAQ